MIPVEPTLHTDTFYVQFAQLIYDSTMLINDSKSITDLKESIAGVELKYDTADTPDITRL